MKWISVIVYCFSTWLLSSLLNGICFTLLLHFTTFPTPQGSFWIIAIVGSLIFSVPVMVVFFIVFLVAVLTGRSGQPLFRLLLVTGVLLALAASLILVPQLRHDIKLPLVLVLLPPVAAATVTLFLHRPFLISL